MGTDHTGAYLSMQGYRRLKVDENMIVGKPCLSRIYRD